MHVETYHPPKGRPGTIVRYIPYEQNELNEQNPSRYLNIAKQAVFRHYHGAGESERVNEQNPVSLSAVSISSFARQADDEMATPATARDSRLSSLSSLSSYCPHEQTSQEGDQLRCLACGAVLQEEVI